jgi:hypothetical protein
MRAEQSIAERKEDMRLESSICVLCLFAHVSAEILVVLYVHDILYYKHETESGKSQSACDDRNSRSLHARAKEHRGTLY